MTHPSRDWFLRTTQASHSSHSLIHPIQSSARLIHLRVSFIAWLFHHMNESWVCHMCVLIQMDGPLDEYPVCDHSSVWARDAYTTSVLHCVAVCCSAYGWMGHERVTCASSFISMSSRRTHHERIAVYCNLLQCVAVRCSALQCVAVCCSVSSWRKHNAQLQDEVHPQIKDRLPQLCIQTKETPNRPLTQTTGFLRKSPPSRTPTTVCILGSDDTLN